MPVDENRARARRAELDRIADESRRHEKERLLRSPALRAAVAEAVEDALRNRRRRRKPETD